MKQQYRTGDQLWVRERNLAIVLNYLWETGGPTSRSYLTQISGLNKSTVGSLLNQLQSWSLVKESGLQNARPGRPGVLLDINPDAGQIIGAEIAVGYISVVVADMKAVVRWRKQVETTAGGQPLTSAPQSEILERAGWLVEEAYEVATQSRRRLYGIGLGVPGQVNHHTGTLLFAPNLGWRNVPLRDLWHQRFHVPVIVENDANASALGEHMLGVARGLDHFVYLIGDVGLGGGLVLHGKLYGGTGGFAGEVGHMTLDAEGPLCKCGNRGCWETLIGPRAIVERARAAAGAGQAPILLALAGGQVQAIELEQVIRSAALNEPAVIQVLDEIGRYLGVGIANLINALNPKMIVLGGVLSAVGPYILPRARQEVDARALETSRADVDLKISAFETDGCVIGGVALILRRILSNPTIWHDHPAAEISLEERTALTTGLL